MFKAYALAGLAAMLSGCAAPASAWKGKIEWPKDYSDKNLVPFMDARAALAAAAAVRERVRQNTDPGLFWGCSTPEQGLDVGVFSGPTPGLYYVLVDQRFDRCGGPRVRELDGWYEYAVTPQGVVVSEAPPPSALDYENAPLSPEPPPAPCAPSPGKAPDAPALTPPANSPAPEAAPPSEPSPASPSPGTTAPAAPEGPPSSVQQGPLEAQPRR